MAHQLKVERSKSCGQLFPLSEKNFLRFRSPSARKGEGGGNVPRETHQKTNVSQEKDKIRKHERELENVKSY